MSSFHALDRTATRKVPCHRYSFNNHLMISLQRPDATVVAGFNRWKSLGRFVKKGEKGIAIFAPCKYKTKIETDDGDGDGDGKTLQQIRGFRVVHVFHISQTEGEELPDLDAVRPKLLDASVPDGVWDALAHHVQSIGYEVVRHQRGSENGYCDFLSKQIGARPDVSGAQAVKTLIHEVGHALLHAEGPVASREVAEVEVESVAYIVCDALGLDSGDHSFPYITRWAEGSSELVKETAERVIGCAKHILAWLEEKPTMAAQSGPSLRNVTRSAMRFTFEAATRHRVRRAPLQETTDRRSRPFVTEVDDFRSEGPRLNQLQRKTLGEGRKERRSSPRHGRVDEETEIVDQPESHRLRRQAGSADGHVFARPLLQLRNLFGDTGARQPGITNNVVERLREHHFRERFPDVGELERVIGRSRVLVRGFPVHHRLVQPAAEEMAPEGTHPFVVEPM
jgi:antirestriction protein ArdC